MSERRSDPVGGFVSAPVVTVHSWAMWSLVRGEFTDPDGETFVRSFVTSPGAVGVVALSESNSETSQPHVVLVRQYRPALHRLTLELPAGMRDRDGEAPLVTAQRELREEVGLEAARWTRLGRHVSAPGISDSRVEIFLARDLRRVDYDRHGPEERHMTIERIPLDEALAMVVDGRIDDAKTVIGLLSTERLLRTG
ncbi:MAG: NUDIX domain-containing protein [Ilumatobacteraceae bacterium]|nr:ADP-ribose pyrophosphatase [Actinomycetes bacterium]